MPTGFVVRCAVLGLCLVLLFFVARLLRPSRVHGWCALLGALVGAFGDWWVEVLIFKAGIWEQTGRLPALSLLGVPLEMPLTFIPAGMAGLWLLSAPRVLGSRRSPARVLAVAYVGWCLFGSSLDTLNLLTATTMRSDWPLAVLLPLYVVPFWFLISATAPFFYWLALKVVAPELSVFDVRSRPAGRA